MLRWLVPCLALAVLLAPRAASAANENKPRVQVNWTADACSTVVDRATTPTLHLSYAIGMEDDPDMLGPDEVDDARTHQFFAFRRLDYAAVSSQHKLPPWITQADIDRAAVVDPLVVELVAEGIPPADILEGGPRFAAADWVRITGDDARVPINHTQAAMGVDWDLADVAPGGYTLWGYTWDPILNLWSLRPGFVKVIASTAEADAAGPVIALLVENPQVRTGEPHPVPGCVDAPAGTTITLEWGTVQAMIEPQWQPLVEDEPIATGMLDLEMVLPAEAADGTGQVKLRATVTDPAGNQYVAYSPGTYAVMPGTSSGDDGDDDGGGGCCSVSGHSLRDATALAVLALLVARRRRTGGRS